MRTVVSWFTLLGYLGAFAAFIVAATRYAVRSPDPAGPMGPAERSLLFTVAPAMYILFVLAPALVPASLGVSPDSTQYLATAGNILAGKGLQTHWWDVRDVPLTHFPPLLPIVIAGASTATTSLEQAAQAINVLALAVTLMVALHLVRLTTGSVVAGVAAVSAIALARDVQQVHAMVFSEPLYIALSLVTLLLILRARRTSSLSMALVAGVFAGTATTARYAGVALIAAGVVVLACAHVRSARIRAPILFALAAAVPVSSMLARNVLMGGGAANREVAFHPPQAWQLRQGASTLFHWLVPLDDGNLLARAVIVAIAIALSFGTVAILRTRPAIRMPQWPVLALVVYGVTYVGFVLLSVTFVDAQIDLGPRLMAPLIPIAVMLATIGLHAMWRQSEYRRPAGLLALACATAVLVTAPEARGNLGRISPNYNTPEWRSSALIAAVLKLPAETLTITNYPDAVLYVAGRRVAGIPRTSSSTSLRPDTDYATRIRELCALAASRRVTLAYFTKGETFSFLPPIDRLRQELGTRPLLTVADGVLETVPPNCGRGGAQR
jgi:hypothetical protein